ncbi:hypothetical protein ETAA8_06640 [Anatilimnocola aggregata]|uniref:Uncharacterized protein n=1 Tax=Anatilimnocola aggregata TaxID=2528021 RepID=A0A517Y5S7_9BACT|nr:hypothetical protein [Anatilimnocola aggregata]QDU25594.1 hypothetical protein ETAA8_06640 [Anatilimnocola aggregata]
MNAQVLKERTESILEAIAAFESQQDDNMLGLLVAVAADGPVPEKLSRVVERIEIAARLAGQGESQEQQNRIAQLFADVEEFRRLPDPASRREFTGTFEEPYVLRDLQGHARRLANLPIG